MKQTTLCFLVRKGEVLLAMKKRGFGVGKFNGVGGKVESGESVVQATIREAEEEIGVRIKQADAKQKAHLTFFFEGKPEWNQECHVFVVSKWASDPVETDEMRPEWFQVQNLPFDGMWIDDPLWLPRVLRGESLKASFVFDQEGKKLLSSEVEGNVS
ncbi:MAG: 8-oxo-dGTP diphosphatase [Candidatus Taylorbacteria bacterium]|nr:8-oxo-dGTP diphosphatase [Candidatus Taylorbacteria bacterium]